MQYQAVPGQVLGTRVGGGADTLDSGPGDGDDHLYGNEGNDGGDGNDTIYGGPGNDELIGGGDGDIFVFEPANDIDTIRNFNVNEDHIDLTAFNLPKDYTPELSTVNDDTLLNLANVGGGKIIFEELIFNTNEASFIV